MILYIIIGMGFFLFSTIIQIIELIFPSDKYKENYINDHINFVILTLTFLTIFLRIICIFFMKRRTATIHDTRAVKQSGPLCFKHGRRGDCGGTALCIQHTRRPSGVGRGTPGLCPQDPDGTPRPVRR